MLAASEPDPHPFELHLAFHSEVARSGPANAPGVLQCTKPLGFRLDVGWIDLDMHQGLKATRGPLVTKRIDLENTQAPSGASNFARLVNRSLTSQ